MKRRQKEDMGTPIDEITKDMGGILTRRHAIAAGVLALGGIAVWRGCLSDTVKDTSESEEITPTPSSSPEYEQWAPKIELPEMTFNSDDLGWSQEQKRKHFFPKNARLSNIPKLNENFDQFKKDLLHNMTVTKDPQVRMQLIQRYAQLLLMNAFGSEQVRSKNLVFGSHDFDGAIDQMNEFLVPKGDYVLTRAIPQKGVSISFYKIEKIASVTMKMGDKSKEYPVVHLDKRQNCTTIPDLDYMDTEGRYFPERQYLMISPKLEYAHKGVRARPDLFKAMIQYSLFHEGMHAAFTDFFGVEGTYNDEVVKRKGDIQLKNYKLPEAVYKKRPAVQVHELAGCGYGLMHSGHAAQQLAMNLFRMGTGNNYDLAVQLIMSLVSHSQSVDANLRSKMVKSLSDRSFEAAIKQLSNEEIHQIGEQMVKLAIYLTRED